MSSLRHEGVIMVRGKGIGFITVPNELEDILIPRESLNRALNGDLVEVELQKKITGKRREGRVLRVITPAHQDLIGNVKERTIGSIKEYFLFPDNPRIHIRPLLREATAANCGMKVVVLIKDWSQPNLEPTGTIVETIGRAGDHETEMQAIIRGGGFSENFVPEIATAAQDLYDRKEEIFTTALKDPKRRDMRGIPTMTIDPVDAKDFDDALSLQILPDGSYEIGVHIADVSHYVEDGGHIDMEARDRGTSIYLVDRVIPMLPEVLSNDLCSLRPHEDRLAFSAIFTINTEARVTSEWYGQTIIHSQKRFSYEEAQEVLDHGSGTLYSELSTMMRLSRIIRERRFKNGAIAFEQPEVKFELDEQKRPVRAFTKVRTETMLMIEDFMLMANEHVARHINTLARERGHEPAFVYRVHDIPDPEKIEELSLFIHALGYEFENHKGIVGAKEINKLLKDIGGTPEENLIKTATIRSMAKAVYSTKNIGHYGLAFKYYTHFTSPIRRYPDLMVHRLLRRHLDGSRITPKELSKFEKLSVQSSEREVEAVRAERDSIKYKQVEFMAPHVGETFDGVITGVTEWGVYVEDQASKSEGMVRLSSIKGDYFEYEAAKYRIKGKKTGKVYRLGDPVKIKLLRADLEEKQLDFELV